MNITPHPGRALYRGLALGAVLALVGAAGAQAHAKLLRASPPIGGVANGAPGTLDLSFSEVISGDLSGATVTDARGKALTASAMLEPKDAKSLMVMLDKPLKSGTYTVAWHAVASDDGHRTSGTYVFTVR
jgi:methionine-rich copper-binding protein CopC